MSTQNTIDRVAAAHYVATDAQIEAIAHDAYTAGIQVQRADGAYLRILIAGCQSQLGAPVAKRRKSAGDIGAQMTVLEATHERYYAAVLRGVTTPDVAPDASLEAPERQRRSLERNRRSVFARSAKSTLASYVRAGGDIRGIVVDTATKAALREFVRPAGGATASERLTRTHSAFIKAASQCCTDSPDTAREEINRAMSELRQLLHGLDEPEPVARRHARTVAGEAVMR